MLPAVSSSSVTSQPCALTNAAMLRTAWHSVCGAALARDFWYLPMTAML